MRQDFIVRQPGSAPIITVIWKTESRQRRDEPFGAGGGKLPLPGGLSVDTSDGSENEGGRVDVPIASGR